MVKSVVSMLLTLQCFFTSSQCQIFLNPEEISHISEVISDNMFYPPLNKSQTLKPLVFGLIMSFGGTFNSSAAIPAVRVALDRINSDTTLLPGYSLHYALSDSQVPYAEPKRIALIGGGCSVASESTAEISHHFNLMQISCVTATPILSDRERFPNYFQFLPSNLEFAPTYLGIIKEFNWKHVGIIVQDETLFTMTVDKLKDLLAKENITHNTYLFYSRTGLASLLGRKPFSDPNERIYIIASYAPYTRELLCEAYQRNIKYPTHMLLTFQWYGPEWWLVEDQKYKCTGNQRGDVLHMTLSMNIFTIINEGNFTNTSMNLTEEEFRREESKHINKPPFYFSRSPSSHYCHDATWALAWSLNKTLSSVNQDLSYLNYTSDTVTNNIVKHMNNSFMGLSGSVTFDDNGIRKANKLLVFQHKKDKGNVRTRQIGSVEQEDGQYHLQYLSDESQVTVWPNELIPYDGVQRVVIDTVPLPLLTISILLAAAGLLFTVGCLIFNILFRSKRIMQISRPRLNYLINIGAILFYICIVTLVVPTTDRSIFLALFRCRGWLLSLGFTFCYGTIIMKMCRVYYIVHNPRPNKNIEDWILMLGVLILVIIDLILLSLDIIINEALGENEATLILVPNKDNPRTISGQLQILTDHMIYKYPSLVHQVFVGLLYSYKMFIQLVALLLALCTHNIKVKGLDDAKYIIAGIYLTTINVLASAMTTYALTEYLSTYTAMFVLMIFFATTLILALVYIPKMIALYKDPKGERVFDKYEVPSFRSQHQPIHHHQEAGSSSEIDSLKKRILELENIVTNKQHSETVSVA